MLPEVDRSGLMFSISVANSRPIESCSGYAVEIFADSRECCHISDADFHSLVLDHNPIPCKAIRHAQPSSFDIVK